MQNCNVKLWSEKHEIPWIAESCISQKWINYVNIHVFNRIKKECQEFDIGVIENTMKNHDHLNIW